MAKKNANTSAISTIASASVQVGTREVVSVATARIEVSLKQQLDAVREQQAAATKATKEASKVLERAVEAQGKDLLSSARVHAEALALISGGSIAVEESFDLEEERDDEEVVTSRSVKASIGLTSTSHRQYNRTSVTIVQFSMAAEGAVVEACQAVGRCLKEETRLEELRSDLNRKLASIPSLERQFMARMAESVLGATEGGKAMLSQVDDAVKAMGFGDLPMLTAVK